jgi:hypothetical protein
MRAQQAVTNDRGQYRFPLLNPGTYKLSYERSGFATLLREGIVVSVGFSAEVNVQLIVEAVKQTVVVRGDTPLIDRQNTTVQGTFSSETLKALPNARDLMSVIGLLPATMVGVATSVVRLSGLSRSISHTDNSVPNTSRVASSWTASTRPTTAQQACTLTTAPLMKCGLALPRTTPRCPTLAFK